MSKNTIKALLSSIGFSGALLVLGYMIDASQQHLLGFEVRSSQSIQSYLFLGGGMLVGTFVSAILWGLENLAWIGILLSLAIIVFLTRKKLNYLRWTRMPSFGLVGPVVLLVGIADVVLLDLPTFQLKEVLRSDVKYRPGSDLPPFLRARGEIFWRRMVCSRLPDQSSRAMLRAKNVDCKKAAELYTRANRDTYLANAVLAVILLVTTSLFFLRLTKEPGSASSSALVTPSPTIPQKPSILITALLGLLTFVNTLLLPWSYGKLQESTVLKEVIVHLETGKDKVAVEHGFVLSEDDTGIALFHKRERQLWFIPRKQVILVKVERQKDVVAHYYSSIIAQSSLPPTAPPPAP